MGAGRLVRWAARAVGAVVSVVAVDVAMATARAVAAGSAGVVERGSGRPVAEPRPAGEHARIVAVWTTVVGSRLLCNAPWFLRYLERMTVRCGDEMDRPADAGRLDRFVEDYDIDLAELDRDLHDFSTVNEVFSRPMRAGARPIARPGDGTVAVCPADGRLTVVTDDREVSFVIKGRRHDVATLLGATAPVLDAPRGAVDRVQRFHRSLADGVAAAVFRLAPGDYHRVHWPVSGTWDRDDLHELAGEYHSVAAPCVAGPVDVLGRNRRSVAIVDTDAFGEVAVVVIGAVKVGSIEVVAPTGPVAKGDEMARFRYGGSTVVTLFRRGSIELDAELCANSARGVETLVRMGTVLGSAAGSRGGS